MKPCLKDRHVVEVNANQTWDYSLRYRIYSCPDTYEKALGATALMLTNAVGRRVPLEISAVVKLAPGDRSQLDALAQPFRARLDNYEAAIAAANLPQILEAGVAHRFYFLSEEPWPNWLQALTTPNQCPNLDWTAIISLCAESDRFFEWPKVGTLLWPGCTRGNNDQLHEYPTEIADQLRRLGFEKPDDRNNGPAIMAFLAAGGKRPTCGNEGWHIHHIYDGTDGTPHAVHNPNLFTHSAGLVAAHPVAHHLAHKSQLLKGLLRREAFLRFDFDPMGVFIDA
jgi:hypothetical protein